VNEMVSSEPTKPEKFFDIVLPALPQGSTKNFKFSFNILSFYFRRVKISICQFFHNFQ
jgi:hypothetical protein